MLRLMLGSKSDEELVALAQSDAPGGADAMQALLSRHYDRLYAICRRVAGNDADAADGCQEALMSIVRGLPRYDGRASFKTWSYRVATNACLDELRRRKRRPLAMAETPEAIGDGPWLDDRVVDSDHLDHALAQLPEEFRLPVVLRDVGGLDYAEIATALDIPPGTVRSRIARGRRQLTELLGEGGQTKPGGRKSGAGGNQKPSDERRKP
jgi:RNA polymerase sigma-70 factor (ECF subfamily)